MMQQRREQGMAEGMHLDDNDMNMMNHDMSNMHMEDPLNGMADDTQPQFLAQQAAAMALVNGNGNGEEEDEFKYNYNNPLDSSHFVPNMNDPADNDDGVNAFDFNLNGYDLIDVDHSKKLNVIQVEFATKAKKVNVRKLKYKLWDKLASDLPNKAEINKENVEKNSNRNVKADEEDEDVEMNGDGDSNNQPITFQSALDSLPSNLSSCISVHMCFICLLHLANEKELQFVPKLKEDTDDLKTVLERGNFEIQYANQQSQFEKDAEKINPVMVLGMQ